MPAFSANSKTDRPFCAIYVEEAAWAFPLTRQLLDRMSACPVIRIRHYKDVFNRARQNPVWQKEHQALILAVKESPCLYDGPKICQHFGAARFFYANFMLNCPFDCTYCYLQGLFPSAHIVAFVNPDDILNEMAAVVEQEKTYLALSHDADLMAFHAVLPYLDLIAKRLEKIPHLLAEVRTKSANRQYYLNHEPTDRLVFAFSLAPDAIIRRYERRTPSLDSRLTAIETALERGFNVRLCFDPVIISRETDDSYPPFFQTVFERIDPERILDASYGFFRLPDTFFRRMAKRRPELSFFREAVTVTGKIRTYPETVWQAVAERHLAILSRYVDPAKLFMPGT